MKEIVYNILRKMVQNPESVEYKEKGFGDKGGSLFIKDNFILNISHMRHVGVYMCFTYDLSGKEIDRILECVQHCQAMKIRGL